MILFFQVVRIVFIDVLESEIILQPDKDCTVFFNLLNEFLTV